METPGASTTLSDLHRPTPLLWLSCERCQHHAPLARAVAGIGWAATRRAMCCASALAAPLAPPRALPSNNRDGAARCGLL